MCSVLLNLIYSFQRRVENYEVDWLQLPHSRKFPLENSGLVMIGFKCALASKKVTAVSLIYVGINFRKLGKHCFKDK